MIRLRESLARWNTLPWRMLSHAVPASLSTGATEPRAAGSWTPSPMPRASPFTRLFSSLPHHLAPLSAGTLAELTAAVSGRLSTAPSVLTQHGTDESYHEPIPPEAVRRLSGVLPHLRHCLMPSLPPGSLPQVAFPLSSEEVSSLVTICARTRTPVIPFGTGTSLEGHIAAPRGGLCIDLSRMNQVGHCEVSGGVLCMDVSRMNRGGETVQCAARRSQCIDFKWWVAGECVSWWVVWWGLVCSLVGAVWSPSLYCCIGTVLCAVG